MTTEIGSLLIAPLSRGGSSAMNINPPGAARTFFYQVEDGWKLQLTSVHFIIAGLTAFDPLSFGNIPALANGCDFRIIKPVQGAQNVRTNFLGNHRIATNADFTGFCAESFAIDPLGLSYRHRFCARSLTGGEPLTIQPGFRVDFVIRDDLSLLRYFQAFVHGKLVPVHSPA